MIKKNNTDKIKYIIYVSTIIILVILLLVYIFIGSKPHQNSDSAFFIDHALEQIETNSLFPKDWTNTNDFWIYSLTLLINIFIRFIPDLFLSRQLAVFVETIVFFYLLYQLIIKDLKNVSGFKIFLLLCLSGFSAHMMFELSGDGSYKSIIMYLLLMLTLFIRYIKNEGKKKIYLIFGGLVLLILSSLSLRFAIIFSLPLITSISMLAYAKGIKKYYKITVLTVILCTVIGYGFHNILQNVLLHRGYTNLSQPSTAILIQDFETLSLNTRKVIFDLFWLGGATDRTVFIFNSISNFNLLEISSNSILMLFVFTRVVYTIITCSLPIILLKVYKKFTDSEKILYIYSTTVFIMTLFFSIFGNLAWWHRYLIPVLFFLNLLYILLYKYFIKEDIRKKIIFLISLGIFICYSIFLVTTSYIDFKTFKIKEHELQGITDFLVENNLTFGYTHCYYEHNIYNLLSNGKVRITSIQSDSPSKYLWLCSDRWYTTEYYNGPTFLLKKTGPIKLLDINEKIYYTPNLPIESEADEILQYEDYKVFIFPYNFVAK